MKLFNKFGVVALTATVALASGASAEAAVILNFAGSGLGTPITAVNNGMGTTTISATDAAVTITGIAAGVATPVAAFFRLNTTSIGPATLSLTGDIVQQFQGTFSVRSVAGGVGGVNYLSGSFTDTFTGSGTSAVMQASQPPGMVMFTSDVITSLDLGRALGLSFSSVNPPLTIVNGSVSSFTSSVTGTFSAENPTQVPEPATMALMGLGLLGAGIARRRKQ